mgnify:FL=1
MTVLLIRANRNEVDREALRERGVESVVDPYLQICQVDNPQGAARLLAEITNGDAAWLVITSHNALDFWASQLPAGSLEAALRDSPGLGIAAIGSSSARAIRGYGATDILLPSEGTSRVLAEILAERTPGLIVMPSGSLSMRSIPDTLEPRGFRIIEEVFYRTEFAPEQPPSAGKLSEWGITDVLFRSPSAVRAFVNFQSDIRAGVRMIATGPTTAAEMQQHGIPVAAVCPDSSPETVATTIASLQEQTA